MTEKNRLSLRRTMIYSGIVAVCFLYTGSAYMSQFYRLMEYFDGQTVDVITSCVNYALQAAGMLTVAAFLKKRPDILDDGRFFTATLLAGIPFMAVMLLARSGNAIVASGCVYNLFIGLYFGCYLALFAENVPLNHSGISYGAAYALGSVGTYIMSLFSEGAFLTSGRIVILYTALALIAVFLVHCACSVSDEKPVKKADRTEKISVFQPALTVAVMTIISVIGSGLYYSLPQAANIDWNLIRVFYAVGLILTGAVIDRSRWTGEILVTASLIYPLIAFALIGEGLNNTAALAFSYLFRGCLTVYYIIFFTDIASSDKENIYISSIGLVISRVAEAILTLVLMLVPVSNLVQIVAMALLMIVLIVFIVTGQKKYATPSPSVQLTPQQRQALYAEKYNLTAREAEILALLADGLTDDEISQRVNISRNTVRFHVSNILKKTGTSSRVEAARSLQKYS